MTLKIFHTSDWHLGKKLYKVSRIPEQHFFLDWLIDEIKNQKIDALIIAGDLFDSPIPPTEALALYFSFLNRLIQETQCNAYIIAGNHDSGKFLDAPKSILPPNRIFIKGQLDKELKLTVHNQSNEHANLMLLPYFRSYEIINLGRDLNLDLEEKESCDQIIEVIRTLISSVKKDSNCLGNILVAHHLFGNFLPEGSEQSLTLSGLDSLPLELFTDTFDYLALGHIHKPQALSENAIYSGSPIPFRFSETQQKILKSLTIDTDRFHIENIIIPQARKLYSIKCDEQNYPQVIKNLIQNEESTSLKSLLEIKLHLTDPKSEIVDHIRELISDSNIELLAIHTILPTQDGNQEKIEIEPSPDLATLFEQYYKIRNPDSKSVPETMKQTFHELLEEIYSLEEQ